jgi:hypothetical protein
LGAPVARVAASAPPDKAPTAGTCATAMPAISVAAVAMLVPIIRFLIVISLTVSFSSNRNFSPGLGFGLSRFEAS